MANFDPIKADSLHSRAFCSIKDIITKGGYKVGEKLPPENQLCDQLQISRNILREVMKSLQTIGLVKIIQGSGTIVDTPKITIAQDMIEMYLQRANISKDMIMQARLIYEPGICQLAALNRDDDDLKTLYRNMEQQAKSRDIHKSASLDLEFHMLLVAASKNDVFLLLTKPLLSALKEVRLITLKQDGPEKAKEHHKRIYEAISAKDSEAARTEMQDHLASALGIYDQEK